MTTRHNGIEATRWNRTEQLAKIERRGPSTLMTKQERQFRKIRAEMMGRIIRLKARNLTLRRKFKAAVNLLTEEQAAHIDATIKNPLTVDEKFRHKKPPMSEYRRIVNDLIAVGIVKQDGRSLVIS